MPQPDESDLAILDEALLALRRFLQAPRTVPDGDGRIKLSTLLVLHALEVSGAATVADVATRLEVTHSTASRLVQRAVDAGMVTRRPGADPRRVALTPTADGSSLSARAREFRHAQLRRRLGDWTPTEVRAFGQAMHRFAHAPPEPPDAARSRAFTPL